MFEPAHTALGDYAVFVFAARLIAQGQVLYPAIGNPGGRGVVQVWPPPFALRMPDELARL